MNLFVTIPSESNLTRRPVGLIWEDRSAEWDVSRYGKSHYESTIDEGVRHLLSFAWNPRMHSLLKVKWEDGYCTRVFPKRKPGLFELVLPSGRPVVRVWLESRSPIAV